MSSLISWVHFHILHCIISIVTSISLRFSFSFLISYNWNKLVDMKFHHEITSDLELLKTTKCWITVRFQLKTYLNCIFIILLGLNFTSLSQNFKLLSQNTMVNIINCITSFSHHWSYQGITASHYNLVKRISRYVCVYY